MTEKKKPESDEVSEDALKDVSGGALTVGKPEDKYEREADEVTDRVISQQAPKTSQ